MRGIVPDEILERRDKVGFETPQRSWLRSPDLELYAWLEGARAYPYIDVDALQVQLADWLAGRRSPLNDELVWRLLSFSRWFELTSLQPNP
jgi:asparagine synthase (glutamine-hydrolysing)